MIDGDARLESLRRALLVAAGADLAGAEEVHPQAHPQRRPRPRRRPQPHARSRSQRQPRADARPRWGRSARAKLAFALVAAVLAIPAGAFAIRALGAGHSPTLDRGAAHGLPASSMAIAATEPTCVTLRRNVEYDCLLSASPGEEPRAVAAATGNWRGHVVATVDAGDRVDGGCRSVNVAGTRWHCFLGAAAVHHNLIAPGSLGDYRPGIA
jgi:hypothetical protein